MRHKLAMVIFLSIAAVSSLLLYRYFSKSWKPYYKEKLYKEPRPLLIKAIELFKDRADIEKNALDLGAGVGNEVAFLLKSGWHVWANDIEGEAINTIASRKDIGEYTKNLILYKKSFIDLPWEKFPKFNLIHAGFALSFAKPTEFPIVMQRIEQVLSPNGLFVGNFFGVNHAIFNWWQKRKMTFLTKEKLLSFFKNFKIEYFEETHEKNAQNIIEHSIDIIATKL